MGTSKMNHKLCMCAASEMPGVWIKLHCIVCLSEMHCCLSIWDGFSRHMLTSLTPSFLQVTFPCVISSCLCLPHSAAFTCPFIWKASVHHIWVHLHLFSPWEKLDPESVSTWRLSELLKSVWTLSIFPPILPCPTHLTIEKMELTSLCPF